MKKFVEIAFSGIIGVILTLAYQFFFEKPPVFIINGQEVNATEETYLELSRQKDELQNELNQLQDQYLELGNQYNEQSIKYNELAETYNELITNIYEENQNQELATNENEENQNQESKPTSEIVQRSISLRKVNEFYSDGIRHSTSNITDNIGNSYEGYTWVVPEGSVVYRNNSQYSHFYGRVIVSDYDKNTEDCGWIKIYGDDILLFDSGVMGRGIIPVDFNLDISNYSEIRIDFKYGPWSSQTLSTPHCYLVDTYFVEI